MRTLHRVPLSDTAISLIAALYGHDQIVSMYRDGDYVIITTEDQAHLEEL